MTEKVLIIGAGQAGGQLAASLRSEGFAGAITLIGEESQLPYQRPPLSKQLLAGEVGLERVIVKPEEFYAKSDVMLRLATRAESIDRAAKTVTLSDG